MIYSIPFLKAIIASRLQHLGPLILPSSDIALAVKDICSPHVPSSESGPVLSMIDKTAPMDVIAPQIYSMLLEKWGYRYKNEKQINVYAKWNCVEWYKENENQCEAIYFNIKWIDWNWNTLKTDSVKRWSMPIYNWLTPIKDSDYNYNYTYKYIFF